MEIFTIGYEGTSFEEWIAYVVDCGITCLVDIRELPVSRKRGFSKTKLATEVEERGIKYIHYRSLGSPTDVRKRLHETKDYITFFDAYDKHLDEHMAELSEVAKLASQERICLLCFERNHRQCHRNAVAKRLASLIPEGIEIVNVDCGDPVARKKHPNHSKNVSNG